VSSEKLIVDLVEGHFTYVDAIGAERRAPFPSKKRAATFREMASLLASVRGWGATGGQDEWWQLTFDEHMTDHDLGDLVPNWFQLELTKRNPHREFTDYVSLRGTEETLKPYGKRADEDEEVLSFVTIGSECVEFLYSMILENLEDAASKGYHADPEGDWLMRSIYKKAAMCEIDLRTSCRYERPGDWVPTWE
jgi:hypothetical protein